jgi:hypothetical protein
VKKPGIGAVVYIVAGSIDPALQSFNATQNHMENAMQNRWLVMAALAGAIFTLAPRADAMTNTMPAGLAKSADQVAQVEQARWVCGPFRCWWRPNYYGYYGHYGYRPFYRHWGWHRGGW